MGEMTVNPGTMGL